MTTDADAQPPFPPADPGPGPDYTPYTPWPGATTPLTSGTETPVWHAAPLVYPPMTPYGPPSQPLAPFPPAAPLGASGPRGSGPFTGPVGYGGPPTGGYGMPTTGAYGPPPAPVPMPYPAYQHSAVVVRGAGANGAAVAVEAILAFFGFYGVGWLMAGEVTTGVLLMLGGFVWDVVAFVLMVATLGIGTLCVVPLHLAFLALSAALLANHTRLRS